MRGRKIVVGKTSLTLYARHRKGCPEQADNSGTVKCDCIRWMQFTDGSRETTHQWTWTKAEEVAKKKAAELEGVRNIPSQPEAYTVEAAVEEWIAEREKNGVHSTKAKYLSAKLLDWCRRNGIVYLHEIRKQALRKWRTTEWKYRTGDSTSLQIHWSVLRNFFEWCVDGDMLETSPCPRCKGKVKQREVVPLTEPQIDSLLATALRMPKWTEERRLKIHALILLMEWGGLAINDAVCLERGRLVDRRIRNKRHKTDKYYYVPIPRWVADLLVALPNVDNRYFFWHRRKDGSAIRRKSIVTLYGKWSREVFEAAGIDGHSHQLRHRFATHHLSLGQRVAEWLGHNPSETIKTYKHWITENEALSDSAMEDSFRKMGLDAVGNPVNAPTGKTSVQ